MVIVAAERTAVFARMSRNEDFSLINIGLTRAVKKIRRQEGKVSLSPLGFSSLDLCSYSKRALVSSSELRIRGGRRVGVSRRFGLKLERGCN